jgi:hypothetical protein
VLVVSFSVLIVGLFGAQVFLNDLGSACKAGELVYFQGALRHSPTRVLRDIASGGKYVAHPAHDVEMVVKAVYQRLCPAEFDAVHGSLDVPTLLEFWRSREVVPFMAEMLDLARVAGGDSEAASGPAAGKLTPSAAMDKLKECIRRVLPGSAPLPSVPAESKGDFKSEKKS